MRQLNLLVLIFTIIIIVPALGYADEITNPAHGGNLREVRGALSEPEVILTIAVGSLGAFVLMIEAYIFRANSDVELVQRCLLITLIIVGTLILVTAGLSNSQIAAATGLFGSIVGYLLGRDRQGKGERKDEGAP